MGYFTKIAKSAPLHRKSGAHEVVAKYNFAANLLEAFVNNASFLAHDTLENLLEWLKDALDDVRNFKEMLPDAMQAELEALHRLCLACTHIARYHHESYWNLSPMLRKSAEAGEKYWREVARQTVLPTPRAQKIFEKLGYRYHW